MCAVGAPSALNANLILVRTSRGTRPVCRVCQSVITTLLSTEHMVARPTTHAVHTRECCLLIESANLWNEVCAQLHASAIRTRWNAVRRELAPREPRLFAFWFCLILGPASKHAAGAAALGSASGDSRVSGLGVVHGSRRSSLRVEIGVGV